MPDTETFEGGPNPASPGPRLRQPPPLPRAPATQEASGEKIAAAVPKASEGAQDGSPDNSELCPQRQGPGSGFSDAQEADRSAGTSEDFSRQHRTSE